MPLFSASGCGCCYRKNAGAKNQQSTDPVLLSAVRSLALLQRRPGDKLGFHFSMNVSAFVQAIPQTHEALQRQAVGVVNRSLTVRNWLIGFYIVEFEQHDEDRAEFWILSQFN